MHHLSLSPRPRVIVGHGRVRPPATARHTAGILCRMPRRSHRPRRWFRAANLAAVAAGESRLRQLALILITRNDYTKTWHGLIPPR